MSGADEGDAARMDFRSRLAAFEKGGTPVKAPTIKPAALRKSPGPSSGSSISKSNAGSLPRSGPDPVNPTTQDSDGPHPSVKDMLAKYNKAPEQSAQQATEKPAPPAVTPKPSSLKSTAAVSTPKKSAAPRLSSEAAKASSPEAGTARSPASPERPLVASPSSAASALAPIQATAQAGEASAPPSIPARPSIASATASASAAPPAPVPVAAGSGPLTQSTAAKPAAPPRLQSKASSAVVPDAGAEAESADQGPTGLAYKPRAKPPPRPAKPAGQASGTKTNTSTNGEPSALQVDAQAGATAPSLPARPSQMNASVLPPSAEPSAPALPQRPSNRGISASSSASSLASADVAPPLLRRSGSPLTTSSPADASPSSNALLPPPSRGAASASGGARLYAGAAPATVTPRSASASSADMAAAGPSRLDRVQWNFDTPCTAPVTAWKKSNGQAGGRPKRRGKPQLQDPDAEARGLYNQLFDSELRTASRKTLPRRQCLAIWVQSRLPTSFLNELWDVALRSQQNAQLLDFNDDDSSAGDGLQRDMFARAMAAIDAELLDAHWDE